MTCKEIAPLLDELVDGTLDDARARAVRGHMVDCGTCVARLAATDELVRAARELEPIDPPASMWDGIAARLDAEQRAEADRPRVWWWWKAWGRFAVPATAMLAAAIVLAVVIARRPHPVVAPSGAPLVAQAPSAEALYAAAVRELEQADADYLQAIGDLKGIIQDERARWAPDVARAFDENLATIDAAVERQREARRKQPGDPAAADALAVAYRREIDFLQEAAVR
jgi:hypothetical protein